MKVIRGLKEWQEYRRSLDESDIGFVPTMGALHEGHLSLLRLSKKECNITVLSIFLNPAQFDQKNDLESYPVSWEQDLELAESVGVDVVFAPKSEEIYFDDYRYRVHENDLSQRLCGKARPGHFDGVLTVVMKLLNLVRPAKAFFGEKDYQQLRLIEEMVKSFFIPVEIVAGPTIREADGLALSSRNRKLTSEEREKAPYFSKILNEKKKDQEIITELEGEGFLVDYIETIEGRRYGAVRLGQGEKEVRLIDNVRI